MVKIKWREIFKFLSGASFAGSIANFYISVPFLGYTISPGLLGARAAVGFLLFVLFFYFGYLKK